MKFPGILAGALLLAASALTASAQVDNYALRFNSGEGIVNLGNVETLASPSDYTLQLWLNPSQWQQGASILRCGKFSIKLGVNHALVINDGTNSLAVTASEIGAGLWSHLTIRTSAAGTTVTVNGDKTFTTVNALNLPATEKSIWLGGNFEGRIDEVRLWNGQLPEDYNSYWRTTLNDLNPSWDSLAAYWKMDQEQCPNLVDYKGNANGILTPIGVEKEKVTDNAKFRYLLNLAYSNVERFFDRAVDARHYSLSNRISLIGAEVNTANATLNHRLERLDVKSTDATYKEAYEGRSGVYSLDGTQSLTLPGDVLSKAPTAYVIEGWLYLTEWAPGATVFSKGSAFAVTLGETANTVAVSINGNKVEFANAAKVGQWFHLGVSVNETSVTVVCDDADQSKNAGSTALAASTDDAVVGQGLKGAIDEVMVWKKAHSVTDIKKEATSLPLADDTKVVTGNFYSAMDACYTFDDADEPGFDSFSVNRIYRTIRKFNEGMRGCRYTVTVSANVFDACFSDANNREKIATAIAAIGNDPDYDGVDLDFEWTYSQSGWNNIALICQGIRSKLNPGKILSVSPHAVSYIYPANLMDQVDYFNFQIYGPGEVKLFTRNEYDQDAKKFINHGYPKEKIVMSYATTTSGGMIDDKGSGRLANNQMPGYYPAGYKGIYNGDPAADMIYHEGNNCYYFLTGFDQSVWRSQYTVENDLGGIMYWDMGNDLPATHVHSVARGATYAVNSNVERLVTSVDSAAPAPADDPNAPEDTEDPEDQGGFGRAEAEAAIAAALEMYNNRAGSHPANSPERQALLQEINKAMLGMTDGAAVTAAAEAYAAATPATPAGPRDGAKYYIYGVSSYDETARYLHTEGNALKVTVNKPETLGEEYVWTVKVNEDGTFTLRNSAGYIATATANVNSDETAACAFPVLAGNAHWNLQLKMSDTQYLVSAYAEQETTANGIVISIGNFPNWDANNPKKWTGQWRFVEVEPAAINSYTVNAGEHGGAVVVADDAHAGHGDAIYVDPNLSLNLKKGNYTGVSHTLDDDKQELNINYSGLHTLGAYRLKDYRNSTNYMAIGETGSHEMTVNTLDEKNPAQIFQFSELADGKYSMSAQGMYIGVAPAQANTSFNASTEPCGYHVIERADGRFSFDRNKSVSTGWNGANGGIALYSNNTYISSWGSPHNQSGWYAEAVNDIDVDMTVNGDFAFATVCMPFGTKAGDGVMAYYVTGVDAKGNVNTAEVPGGLIPANEAVILVKSLKSKAATTATLEIRPVNSTIKGNKLRGTLFPAEQAGSYVADFTPAMPTFTPAAGSLNRNSGYLLTENSIAPKSILIEGVTLGIEEISLDEATVRGIYDLQGRRVENPRRGLYIVNGKLTRI